MRVDYSNSISFLCYKEDELKPNPYIEPNVAEPLVPLPENICDIVYGRG